MAADVWLFLSCSCARLIVLCSFFLLPLHGKLPGGRNDRALITDFSWAANPWCAGSPSCTGIAYTTHNQGRGEIKSVYDYSQPWPRQHGTELSRMKGRSWLWHMCIYIYYFFISPPLKLQQSLCNEREKKKKERNEGERKRKGRGKERKGKGRKKEERQTLKTQINKSKKPGSQDIFAGAAPPELELWNCSAINAVDSNHLFMEKNVNGPQS